MAEPTPDPRQALIDTTKPVRNLFLAITVPDDVAPGEDPDAVADAIVDMLNNHRTTREAARRLLAGDPCLDGVHVERVMVNAIPPPQWLTPITLANLRKAARGG